MKMKDMEQAKKKCSPKGKPKKAKTEKDYEMMLMELLEKEFNT